MIVRICNAETAYGGWPGIVSFPIRNALQSGDEDMDIAGIAKAVREWRERDRARRELQFLSDRELADIGLTRSGIELAVRGEHRRACPTGSAARR